MNPFAAVALAGNILQFVAFAKDCYVQVKQIQESPKDMTAMNAAVLEQTNMVDEFLDSVSAGTKAFGDEDLASTEERMRDAGKECQCLALELREDIKSKAVKPQSGAFRVTANVLMGKLKLSNIQQKLNDLGSLQTRLSRLLITRHIGQQQSGLELAMAKLMENRKLEMSRANDLE